MSKLELAKKAADELFSDRSCSQAEAKSRLEELKEHIDVLIESLDPEED